MGVIRYDIIEDAFLPQKSASSELSILTGVDSSSYLVVDEDRHVLGVRSLTHSPTENWWENEDHLQNSYLKIRLAWLGPKFTLIPARLYNADDRRSYLNDLTQLTDDDTVLADAIPDLDAMLVYPLKQQQLSLWRRNFVGCRFYHALTPVLQHLAKQTSRLGLPRMYAYVRDGYLYTFGIDRHKLHFCNSFPCNTAKDYLYFLLLSYEQCGWNTSKVPLRLFGEIVSDAEVFKLFYRYIKDITFMQGEDMLHWGEKSAQFPSHLFYDLAALSVHH